MKNLQNFFHPAGYQELLQTALTHGYRFGRFDEHAGAPRTVYLRHDIDLSLAHALQMARIEQARGVQATYFLMVRSMFYNLFSAESERMVLEFLQLGHQVGLHFANHSATDDEAFAKNLQEEFSLLGRLTDEISPVFSLHNPGGLEIPATTPYIYVHGERFKTVKYISDSRRYFREGPPHLLFAAPPTDSLQILIHPIFWTEAGENLAAVMENLQQFYRRKLGDDLLQDFDGSFAAPDGNR